MGNPITIVVGITLLLLLLRPTAEGIVFLRFSAAKNSKKRIPALNWRELRPYGCFIHHGGVYFSGRRLQFFPGCGLRRDSEEASWHMALDTVASGCSPFHNRKGGGYLNAFRALAEALKRHRLPEPAQVPSIIFWNKERCC